MDSCCDVITIADETKTKIIVFYDKSTKSAIKAQALPNQWGGGGKPRTHPPPLPTPLGLSPEAFLKLSIIVIALLQKGLLCPFLSKCEYTIGPRLPTKYIPGLKSRRRGGARPPQSTCLAPQLTSLLFLRQRFLCLISNFGSL